MVSIGMNSFNNDDDEDIFERLKLSIVNKWVIYNGKKILKIWYEKPILLSLANRINGFCIETNSYYELIAIYWLYKVEYTQFYSFCKNEILTSETYSHAILLINNGAIEKLQELFDDGFGEVLNNCYINLNKPNLIDWSNFYLSVAITGQCLYYKTNGSPDSKLGLLSWMKKYYQIDKNYKNIDIESLILEISSLEKTKLNGETSTSLSSRKSEILNKEKILICFKRFFESEQLLKFNYLFSTSSISPQNEWNNLINELFILLTENETYLLKKYLSKYVNLD